MMKRFITLALLTLSLVSCSACSKKNHGLDPVDTPPAPAPAPSVSTPPVPQPLPPVDTHIDVKGDSWQFTLPNDGWFSPEDPPEDMVVLINPKLRNTIVLEVMSEYTGTLDALVLNNMRDLRNKGVTILSAKQVELNGTKFVLVEAVKSGNKAWQWFTALNGRAYAFACGGSVEDDHQQLCSDIASTLQLQ